MKKLIAFIFLISLFTSLSTAEKISFHAKRMSGTAGNKNNSTVLQGNAQVKTESMEIFAEYIELYGKDFRYIKARGNVKGINTESEMDFTCENMKYDRKTKIASLEGNVHLVDIKNDVKADAQIIEYNQNTEIAVMQIGINLTQKDNVCTGEHAIYKKNEQLLELNGNPQIKQKDDTFKAQTIFLNMDTQEITLSGRVKGTVKTEEQKPVEKTESEDKNTEQKTAETKKDEKPDSQEKKQ
ncbi:MAG: organic solvent tolerance protein OstA [Spirochaetia bacterium]|nr:organic solvent tolerance protein OstA [Spirochaetia bacterium]